MTKYESFYLVNYRSLQYIEKICRWRYQINHVKIGNKLLKYLHYLAYVVSIVNIGVVHINKMSIELGQHLRFPFMKLFTFSISNVDELINNENFLKNYRTLRKFLGQVPRM